MSPLRLYWVHCPQGLELHSLSEYDMSCPKLSAGHVYVNCELTHLGLALYSNDELGSWHRLRNSTTFTSLFWAWILHLLNMMRRSSFAVSLVAPASWHCLPNSSEARTHNWSMGSWPSSRVDLLYLSYCDSRKVHSASVMPVSRAGLGSPCHPALPFGLGVWPECADLLAW